jgi:long-chain acyl-CoA synthetase
MVAATGGLSSSMVRPWLGAYGDVPATVACPQTTIHAAVAETVRRLPDRTAFVFHGATATYRELGRLIDGCAGAFARLGMRRGDRVTIALPTCPQAVIAFFAASRLGAVPAMMHPLSTTAEVDRGIRMSGSRFALTLDALHGTFAALPPGGPLEVLILTRISDHLPSLERLAFRLTKGRKIPTVPPEAPVQWWRTLLRAPPVPLPPTAGSTDDPAVILFSGGTMGLPKGIVLSHRNLLSEAMSVAAWAGLGERDTVLAALPLFHGFGLNALVNAGLLSGCCVVLVPVFSPREIARVIRRSRPTIMAGVPALYDALTREPAMAHADLSSLRGVFSGADRCPAPVRERFEQLVASRGGHARLLEGYGLTETVTAVIAMPLSGGPEGSLGVPLPDVLVKIVAPGGETAVPSGEEGEICIAGPAVMLGYLDDPAATAEAIRRHGDGGRWLHTGDLGHMDENGFVYFHCRLKRMIKSSGFNVYPAEVEAVLDQHPDVAESCVVGVPDDSQGERVAALVVLKEPGRSGKGISDELVGWCRKRLIKWSCPRDIVFRPALPRTRLGKVDVKAVQRELQGGATS